MGDKQAVLLIHGIGEQRPMETLRGFVDAVWRSDTAAHHRHATPGVWSKPDTVSDNYELRRLTTSQNAHGVRTDFYEFYWAHLMDDTAAAHVGAWARCLLLRWPWNVPRPLRAVWCLLVALVLAFLLCFVQTVLLVGWRLFEIPTWISGLASLVVALIALPLIKQVIGDAARYLHPAPTNIKRRQEIRSHGVALLRTLHERGYERIVVVGHSLGSVIGYDILTYAWPEYHRGGDAARGNPKLGELEDAVAAGGLSAEAYQQRQAELWAEQRANGSRWRVTDFLTLGSPLTHAGLLMADRRHPIDARIAERELPSCPPVLERGRCSYPHDRRRRTLHHAAVFAPTRWTNVYFPCRGLLWGDLIGGPLGPVFGPGVRDVAVRTRLRLGLLSHTCYWRPEGEVDPGGHIASLRQALQLSVALPADAIEVDAASEAEEESGPEPVPTA